MKYKKYLHDTEEIPSNIIEDLSDICLEIEDYGFITNLEDHDKYKDLNIIYKNHQQFPYQEVLDVVERIEDYMIQNGYSTKVGILEHSAQMNLKSPSLLKSKQSYVIRVNLFFQKNNSRKIRKFKDI